MPANITIKSMNQKIRRVAARFGTESNVYKYLIADIEHNFRGQTHYTKTGAIQVTQSKKLQLNQYQEQIVNRVSKRSGVKEIVKKSKERLQKQGIKKPTNEQINAEVKEFERLQNEFDKALDLVYDHEIAGDLPVDIRERYEKIYRHGKGAGMGVSVDDVQYIETKIFEFDDMREKVNDLASTIYETAYSKGVRVSDDIKTGLENVYNGELTTDMIARFITTLEKYLTALRNIEE